MPLRVIGAALALAGLMVLLRAFARFVIEGRGTPAPVAPTERLVIGGESTTTESAYFSSKINSSGATVSRTVWAETSIRVLSPV